jgi:hypothetical protein
VESIVVKKADVPGGSVDLMPMGDQIAGQVTLDNCGYDFTTESLRTARRQVTITPPGATEPTMSNEVVAYAAPQDAQKALQQWYDSAATCPKTPVSSTVAGMPDTVTTVHKNERGLDTLPAKANVVTVESLDAGDGSGTNGTIFIQVHDRYLDAIYLTTQQAPTADQLAEAQRLAILTGTRLVQAK